MRDSSIFYRSFYEAIKTLPEVNQIEVYNAIFEYSFNFVEVELYGLSNTIFMLIKPQLMANNKREAKNNRSVSKQKANNNNKVDNNNENILYVEKGSGWATKMPGYSIAGKTGTAQVAKADGTGYEERKNVGSFVGFAPVEDPKFVMLVRIDYPQVDGFAEKTAVPAFASVAKMLLKYYQVPPK